MVTLPKNADVAFAELPAWLYQGISDAEIARRLSRKAKSIRMLIEDYTRYCGYHSRIQLVLAFIDEMVETNPDHPDLQAAAARMASLTSQARSILAALLRTCKLPTRPTKQVAADNNGLNVGKINRQLMWLRSTKGLYVDADWPVFVQWFYLEQLYIERHILSQFNSAHKNM